MDVTEFFNRLSATQRDRVIYKRKSYDYADW